MKQLSSNLHEDIVPLLAGAHDIRIAVALMNMHILDLLESTLHKECKRTYLIGINLPTHPDVLEKLFALQERANSPVSVKVFKARENYHPKVYIIKHKDDDYTSFLGSANATRGGWYANIEMNSIHHHGNNHELISWFDNLFLTGLNVDEFFLDRYRKAFMRNRLLERTIRSNLENIFDPDIFPPNNIKHITSEQFFRVSDFDAYDPSSHNIHDEPTVGRRNLVRQRLLELDKLIFDRFSEFDIDDLHRHPNQKNTTGLTYPYMGREVAKDAIWLHYGKSEDELQQYSKENPREFSNHIRLQVILRHTAHTAFIGLWLYVGKAGGSYIDRNYIQQRLDSPGFLSLLNGYLHNLGASYYIDIGGHTIRIPQIQRESILKLFLQQDQTQKFKTDFMIGRNYRVDHSDLRVDKIAEVTLLEFSKLFKIFQMFRHRMPIVKKPKDCNEDELTAFRKLVIEGGQLAVSEQTLKQNIEACLYLAFQYKGSELIGISAIKQLTMEKAKAKLAKAKIIVGDSEVPVMELGYSVTKSQYRGNGVNRTLNDRLLELVKGSKIFATTGVAEMKAFLSKRGFTKKGQSYPGRRSETLEYFERIA